jgi:hypothetical protein
MQSHGDAGIELGVGIGTLTFEVVQKYYKNYDSLLSYKNYDSLLKFTSNDWHPKIKGITVLWWSRGKRTF